MRWFDTDNRRYRVDIDTPEDIERFAASTGHALRWPAALERAERMTRSPRPAMNDAARSPSRAHCAWALLLAGWVGLGGVALALTPDVVGVHALVALWLLALGDRGDGGHARRPARALAAHRAAALAPRSRRRALWAPRTAAAWRRCSSRCSAGRR